MNSCKCTCCLKYYYSFASCKHRGFLLNIGKGHDKAHLNCNTNSYSVYIKLKDCETHSLTHTNITASKRVCPTVTSSNCQGSPQHHLLRKGVKGEIKKTQCLNQLPHSEDQVKMQVKMPSCGQLCK